MQVDRTLWPEQLSVGIVRLRAVGFTIIDAGLRLVKLPPSSVEHDVGNTVEWGSESGVVRVLDEKPIDVRDEPMSDAALVAGFRTQPSKDGATFDDFVGLKRIVSRARELVQTPLKHRDRIEAIRGEPIRGVLFTGPPGTGKTLLARIIANQSGANFYEIRGPEIYTKWVGDSERLVRAIFDDARAKSPSIVFFDEIDSVAPRRGGDSHDLTRRVVAQLLTAIDGFTRAENVMVVATTNRAEDIDEALLRPGRFDWTLEFPLPDAAERLLMLERAASQHATASDVPMSSVAERTDRWTPAELAAIWREATILAAASERNEFSAEDFLAAHQRRERERASAAKRKGRNARPA